MLWPVVSRAFWLANRALLAVSIPLRVCFYLLLHFLVWLFDFCLLPDDPGQAVLAVPLLDLVQLLLALLAEVAGALGVHPPLVRALVVTIALDKEVADHFTLAPAVLVLGDGLKRDLRGCL